MCRGGTGAPLTSAVVILWITAKPATAEGSISFPTSPIDQRGDANSQHGSGSTMSAQLQLASIHLAPSSGLDGLGRAATLRLFCKCSSVMSASPRLNIRLRGAG